MSARRSHSEAALANVAVADLNQTKFSSLPPSSLPELDVADTGEWDYSFF